MDLRVFPRSPILHRWVICKASAVPEIENREPAGLPRPTVSEAYESHRSALRAFVARFVQQGADVDDVTQEAFLRAFNAEKAKAIEHPKALLFTIAKNLVLSDFSRKANRLTDYIADIDALGVIQGDSDVESEVQGQEALGAFCEAVALLPVQCRRVYLMRKVYGLSYKEIAARLDISVSTVEKHLVKGLKLCSAHMRAQANT